MFKYVSASMIALLMLVSQPAFAAARLAVLHLAPFADTLDGTAVNISANGTVLFENVKYKDFVPYTELDAGEYTIDITPVGATDPALSATVTLQDGVDYSAYAVGILGVWHYWWQVKQDIAEPAFYAGVLTILLGARLWHYWAAKRRKP